MPDYYFQLSDQDKQEALQQAAAVSGRPANLLEKDIWVVWTLNTVFSSEHGEHMSFKGGTSLSKAYGIIDRFSEDIDLTIDVRSFIPEFAKGTDGLPPSKSQGRKWTEAVRSKLPDWIEGTLDPLLKAALKKDGIEYLATRREGEKLYLDYRSIGTDGGLGYVKPSVMLEFGARSTGEPTEIHNVNSDIAVHIPALAFPTAQPRVMKAERTFWEKATAAHVYCAQHDLKKERFARHWHDLGALARSKHFDAAIKDQKLADMVAAHKHFFFKENDAKGSEISYDDAVKGKLLIVPTEEAYKALHEDYDKMIRAGLFHNEVEDFSKLMDQCQQVQEQVNKAMTRS